MSLETELRDAMAARASAIDSRESDPYARVSAAVGRSRRRRRAVGASAVAAVAALALGVTTLGGRLGDEALPAGRPELPSASDAAWRSVSTWPVRGALAADRAVVDAVDDRFDGRAIFVEDVARTRLALVVVSDQIAVVTGPRGSDPESMSPTLTVPLSEVGNGGALTVAGQGALVILTTPDLRSAEVSGTPAIALDGTVSRTWLPVPLTDGIGRSTAVPLTQIRVGETMGTPRFIFGEEDRPDESQACEGECGDDDLARFEERNVDDEVARALMVDADSVDTRTTWRGQVPGEIATTVTGDVPVGARSTAQVILSTLPGGQVLRTIMTRTDSPTEGRAWDTERLTPVAADAAELRPAVLATTQKDEASSLTAWILAPTGSTVRLVSSQPTVWPTSSATPVRDGVARVDLRVDNLTFEKQYSIEVRRADGSVVGTWAAAPGMGLSAP